MSLAVEVNPNMNRRSFVGLAVEGSFLVCAPVSQVGLFAAGTTEVVRGAGDGRSLDTDAIQRAIDLCISRGGGTVYVPKGIYLVGTLVLGSNIHLVLAEGSRLLGSTNIHDYKPGSEHVLFARDAENISISGPGIIDGQGDKYWTPTHRQQPAESDKWRDVVALDYKPNPRPSPLINFVRCKVVRLSDLTILNSPGWTVRPLGCQQVQIENVHIQNSLYGPNTDGLDISGCQGVTVVGCNIVAGDDAICIKSAVVGNIKYEARDILVENCTVSSGSNGLKVGIEGPSDFRNIKFSNCTVESADSLPLNQRTTAGIAVEMRDGGAIDQVTFTGIKMRNVRTPIFIRLETHPARVGEPPSSIGSIKNLVINGVESTGAILTSSITGIPQHNVENVRLENVSIETEEVAKREWSYAVVPELVSDYPEARMFGRFPSYGFYIRHAVDVVLDNVQVRSRTSDPRSLLVALDTESLTLSRLSGSKPDAHNALLKVRNCQNLTVVGCVAPTGASALLEMDKTTAQTAKLTGNDVQGETKVSRISSP